MLNGGSLAIFAQMMRSLDQGVGRVLAALRRARLERDTLVIFTSDNGGERYSFNWPFSSAEGLFVRGRHPRARDRALAGRRARACRDGAGRDHDGLDCNDPRGGRRATRRGSAARRREPVARAFRRAGAYDRALFWRTRTRAAARIGRWKYVQEGDAEHLYDLGVDLGEKTDLKARETAAFAEAKSRYSAWAAGMLPRPT